MDVVPEHILSFASTAPVPSSQPPTNDLQHSRLLHVLERGKQCKATQRFPVRGKDEHWSIKNDVEAATIVLDEMLK